jgi:hypothetical protein
MYLLVGKEFRACAAFFEYVCKCSECGIGNFVYQVFW